MVKGGLRPPSQQEEVQAKESAKRGVIYILENASLEAAKVGKVRGVALLVEQIVTAYKQNP